MAYLSESSPAIERFRRALISKRDFSFEYRVKIFVFIVSHNTFSRYKSIFISSLPSECSSRSLWYLTRTSRRYRFELWLLSVFYQQIMQALENIPPSSPSISIVLLLSPSPPRSLTVKSFDLKVLLIPPTSVESCLCVSLLPCGAFRRHVRCATLVSVCCVAV